jgi:hypothetical protein
MGRSATGAAAPELEQAEACGSNRGTTREACSTAARGGSRRRRPGNATTQVVSTRVMLVARNRGGVGGRRSDAGDRIQQRERMSSE